VLKGHGQFVGPEQMPDRHAAAQTVRSSWTTKDKMNIRRKWAIVQSFVCLDTSKKRKVIAKMIVFVNLPALE